MYSEYVSAVKIKKVLVKSNIFFPIFVHYPPRREFPPGVSVDKTLLNNGFKLFIRGLEGLFFFSVEPPFRCSFLHQGIDIPHPHQIPDAPQLAAEGRLQRTETHGKAAGEVFHMMPVARGHEQGVAMLEDHLITLCQP